MERLSSLWQDLRVAFRHLAKNPAATALSVLSITLGIGLTTGMFSVIDAVYLRPLPIAQPSQVMYLESRADDGQAFLYGWPDFEDMTRAGKDFVRLAAYQRRGSALTVGEKTVHVSTHSVSINYFDLLGVHAAVGVPSVDYASGRPQAVIGYQLWQRQFGADPGIVGKTILLNRKPFLVSAVMPRAFPGLVRGVATDIWINADAWFNAFGFTGDQKSRHGQFELIARLKPDVTAARAGAALDAVIRGEGKHKPAPAGLAGTVLESPFALSWKDDLSYGGGMLLVLGAILFVACANVAQLRLAQAESRKKELGVRMAMGAGAWRITRQLMVETVVVSAAGAAFGIALARTVIAKMEQFLAAGRTFVDYNVTLDHRVLGFTVGALLLAVLLTGLAPARHALRLKVYEVLKTEQGISAVRRAWQHRVLIIGQVAVSVALFGCAVLFLTSLRNAASVWPGLDPSKNLLVLDVIQGRDGEALQWADPACRGIETIPGVRGATYARRLPLSGSGGGFMVRVEIPGQAPMDVMENNVAGNYFSLLGTRLLAGRGITPDDRPGSPLVVVVSQSFAHRFFGDANPLGQWITVSRKPRQVVGITENAPASHLHRSSDPYLFLPYAQVSMGDLTLMIETAGDPTALERTVRQQLKRFDPGVEIYGSGTLRAQMDEALGFDRMLASVSSGLGLFGVLLTAAGLFGVLQYSVSRRTRELGVRLALGADPSNLQRLILGESLRLSAWGIPIGLGLLAVAVRYSRSLVLGVSPLDPRIYLLSPLAVVALTLLAAWLPARRATRVDPMEALRTD